MVISCFVGCALLSLAAFEGGGNPVQPLFKAINEISLWAVSLVSVVEHLLSKVWKSKICWTLLASCAAFEMHRRWSGQAAVVKTTEKEVEQVSMKSAFLEFRLMEFMYAAIQNNYELLRIGGNLFFEWNQKVEDFC